MYNHNNNNGYGFSHNNTQPQPSMNPAYPVGQWGGPAVAQQQVPPAGPMGDPTLPSGWLKQWNQQYQAWFFVNTLTQPAHSQWIHPGPPGPHPQPNSMPGYPVAGGNDMNPNQPQVYPYQGKTMVNGSIPSGPQGQKNFGNPVNFTPQSQTQFAAKNQNSHGKTLMAAGLTAMGGLAVGALANHEWQEHKKHERREKEEAYEAGFHKGQVEQQQEEEEEEYREYQGDERNNYENQRQDFIDNPSYQTWDNNDVGGREEEEVEVEDEEEGDW